MLTPTQRAEIAAAVAAAEAHTTGEVVPVIEPAASGYGDVALAWSAGVALLALAALAIASPFYLALVDRITGNWDEWTPAGLFDLALVVATLKFVGTRVILQWHRLRLALTPPALKASRVHARAVSAFRLAVAGRTSGATGVLVYVALAERRAVILAEAAISERVAPAVWGAAMEALVAGMRRGEPAAGLVGAIGQIGAVLAQHAPAERHGDNQLPDGAIEL